MRVVVAPDSFTGTLTAVEASAAITRGWRRGAPHDEVVAVPMSDGDAGFVDVVHAALGGRLLAATVSGPLGTPAPATVLLHGTDAYVEASHACGPELVPADERDIWRATSYGVGELVAAAVDAGARRVHVGLGESVTNDGGAGVLAALGAEPADALRTGPTGLTALEDVDLRVARERLSGVELVVLADVDTPLLGLRGTSNLHGARRGARAAEIPDLDAALKRLADRCEPERNGRGVAEAKGAGAAGGIGYALQLLGAERRPAVTTVADLTGLSSSITGAGVVLTGEGAFDWQSMRDTVVSGVATACGGVGAVCIVLAGRVDVGRREMNANGIEAAYAMADLSGGEADALERPVAALEALAERTARNWSPVPR